MAERDFPFRFSKSSPERLDPTTRDQYILEGIEKLQAVERSYQGQNEVVWNAGNDSVVLYEVGDLHGGSFAADHKAMLALRDLILAGRNTGIVLLGDEIEGLKAQYLNTNTARTPIDAHMQIDFLRNSFLEPLAKEKRILAMVSGYWGHPGWIEDGTTINPWILMTQGLDIPILINGGFLKIKFSNGHEHVKQVFHYPRDKSQFDAVYGLRNVAFSQSEGGSRANGYSKGHDHVAMIAKENYPEASITPYYISSGSLKGSNPELPRDRFGIKLGAPLADTIGQGVVIMPRRVGKNYERAYPFISFKHGGVLDPSSDLFNRAEQQGITKELLEKIYKKAPKPEIKFVESQSKETRKPFDEMPENPKPENGVVYKRGDLAPQYDRLVYNVKSQLPVTIHFVANTRLGSSYDGYDALKYFLSHYVTDSPYALTVFLRNMLDEDAVKKDDRDNAVKKYINLIKLNGDQTLGFMLDENLRKDGWKKDKKEDGEVVSHGRPLATEISKQTKARIIHHMSRIKVAVGPGNAIENKPTYSGVFVDKLFRHGSYSRALYGPRRIYDLYIAEKPGYVAGGHMPNSGTGAFFDRGNPETKYPILVGTGWWAPYVDTAGQGNISPGAVAGQGITFMPGISPEDYLAFPLSNPDEADYIPKELTLHVGLKLLGIDPKKVMK